MTSRLAGVLVVGIGLAAGPAWAAGSSAAEVAASAAAFRAAYGSGADVSLGPGPSGTRFVAGFRTEPLAGEPVGAAWRFLEREAALLGMTDPRATLSVERVYAWRGWTMVHFRQTAFGLPVLGHGFVVVADGEGRVYQVAGRFAQLVPFDDAGLLGEAGAAKALATLVPAAEVTSLERAVYADADGARFVYLAVVENGGPFERFEVLQDAATGRPLGVRRLFVQARANVYEVNPVTTPALTEVELLGLTSATNLVGDLATSYGCVGTYCDSVRQNAAPDVAGDYLFTPSDLATPDPFAETEAYYQTDRLNRYLQANLGFTWSCGGSSQMLVAVNMDYPNAWFGDIDGDRCGDATIGRGTERNFAYDSDVIFHEFGHGLFGQLCDVRGWAFDDLGPDFSGGGLGEGTADYVAVTVNDEDHLGEYMGGDPSSGGSSETGIRDAVNDDVCPRSLVGEEHYDGKIWLGTLWEIRTAIGTAKADALMIATVSALSEAANFDEAGRGLIAAAERFVGTGEFTAEDRTAVEAIVTGRGLPGCLRIVDLYDPDTGESFTGTAFSMGLDDMGGWLDELASGIQFRIRTPPTAVRVTLEVTPAPWMDPSAYDLYMRVGEPVHFTISGHDMTLDGYDRVLTDGPGGMTMATWSTPPLVPGSDYYFTFIHRSGPYVIMNFHALVALEEPPEEAGDVGDAEAEAVEDVPVEAPEEVVEAEVAADGDEDVPEDHADLSDTVGDVLPGDASDAGAEVTIGGGGCGCAVAPVTGFGTLFALLLGAALLLRRR
jgi:MYXO-CTERM domain-containing protein